MPPDLPGAAKKAKKSSLCEPAVETHFNIKQEQESAVNTTRNARGQKSTPHFVRACAVETHFNIKQKHESAVNTTQSARGQKSPIHFVRACAVETHFDIKQKHESAVNTTQNARGVSGRSPGKPGPAAERLQQLVPLEPMNQLQVDLADMKALGASLTWMTGWDCKCLQHLHELVTKL